MSRDVPFRPSSARFRIPAVMISIAILATPAFADTPPSPLFTFGSLGSGAGQFDHPYGIAIGPDGLVYVTDEGNDRVEVFKKDGTFVSQFPMPLNENGEAVSPTGIAFSPSGL
ncbi:MAG TPA: hypothetical protein VL123_00990, partial [Candidatus Udaeobacter sp.]|nr:hypothetical protein [Candidatus Udaeobacter sp.]